MDNPKIMSGEEIVARGVTRTDATLPELGLKDVIPNGSWLEQKQTQAALEARKQLIQTERIDKRGTLTHAIWQDKLKLAEVTQMAGSYWLHIGHNVGRTKYLKPEEALFLMELNCLMLKHGGITISLQKAYSLLLADREAMTQYRVYASLSRLGYRIVRHKVPTVIADNNVSDEKQSADCKSQNLHEQLFIDTTTNDVIEQPLTDSSVEMVDSKSSESEIHFKNIITLSNEIKSSDDCNITEINEVTSATDKCINSEVGEDKYSNDLVKENDICMNAIVIVIDKCGHAILREKTKCTNDFEGEKDKCSNDIVVEKDKCVNDIVVEKDKCSNDIALEKDRSSNYIMVENESICVMEVEENETDNINNDNNATCLNKEISDTREDQLIIIENIEMSCPEDVEIAEDVKISCAEDTKIINNVDKQNDTVMNVETSDLKVDSKDDNNVGTVNITNTLPAEVSQNKESEENTAKDVKAPTNNHNPEYVDLSKPIELFFQGGCLSAHNSNNQPNTNNNEVKNVDTDISIEIDSADSDVVMDLDTPTSQDSTIDTTNNTANNTSRTDQPLSDKPISNRNQIFQNYVPKLIHLVSRKYKPSDYKCLEKQFENISDLHKQQIVRIKIPEEVHIPKEINLNNTLYVLNLNEIKNRAAPIQSPTYNSLDEVNGNHVRRIRSVSTSEFAQNLQFVNNINFPPRQTLFFRPFNYWRPQNSLNYVQFNMFFQRQYPNVFFQQRFQYQLRPNVQRRFSCPNNANNSNTVTENTRKRMRSAKATQLQSIKNLAVRLKQLIVNGNSQFQNIESLHRLLYAYNTRYKARLRLTKNFEVISDENIVETIDLEDDDESATKKAKLRQDSDLFDENLELLRQLASKLKDLESKGKATSRHKRAMSKAIKTFNKSYDADIYMNRNFEVINKRLISLDSDSETDCVVSEPKKVHKRKKLRNPFNILKQRSESKNQAKANPSTSKDSVNDAPESRSTVVLNDTKYSEHISLTFNKNWLPNEHDFGRAEVVPKALMNARLLDSIKEDYVYTFMKNHNEVFSNWLEAKIAFLQHMEETDVGYQNDHEQILASIESGSDSGLKPLVDAEDCRDTPAVLEKLRIIKSKKEISSENKLCIHYDVYKRDVPNFRKTSPPKPHFRLVCMEQSSSFPSSADVMALHSKYDDEVNIVFAIVSEGSVSYLQVNPIDLPVYLANNELD